MTAVSTTAALADSAPIPGAGHRIWTITRLHFANRFSMMALPWMILGFVWLVNMVIWISIFAATHEQLEGTEWSGATMYIFVYFAIAAVQAMNLTFRFAVGMSATRRDYYLGTVLAFVLQGLFFAVACTLLSYVEDWTHGYGMSAHMFSNVYFGTGPVWERLFATFAAFMVCFTLGALAGSVYVRWRANGLYTLGAIVVLILAGLIAAATLTSSWPAVGQWFLQVRAVGVVAWLLIPAAVSLVLGYFVLRKAPSRA
ncbi:hypothetical protein [Humibacter ginsenosidimutans]|uniref:Uncharacterized protein n=1 Tax=Humibacter ginsenosidimutans TaxID=2599293 RepID=A0A5B8M8G8_9MICO|nr:hypothetical protein [Humibacter ginsenosidimutans]QDZ16509.1 hypothetical protein FPZ11_18720 [Humibacter ginsenosidimutans]